MIPERKLFMKQCPRCRSIVNEKSECPVCYTTITYEDEIAAASEKIAWNRYTIIYFIKQMWISVLCCIVGVVKLCFSSIEWNEIVFDIRLSAILFALASLGIAIFQRKLALSRWSRWKYTKEYAKQRLIVYKYLFAILSIFLFIIL